MEKIEINNAGLVLFNPWLPRLFHMTGLLNEERRSFKDKDAQIRAIFMLQYLVFGEEKEYEKKDLEFNCLLTGYPFDLPLPKNLSLTNQEKETLASLMSGVKHSWDKMRNTSEGGFREAFIHREGYIEQKEEYARWVIHVKERAYDILLDSVPWSFKVIRYPWTDTIMQVEWRESSR